MNQKTKISTKFPRSKLGVATAALSLGGVIVYTVGVMNPLLASQNGYLQVDGVQNSVQYLTSLVISGVRNKVEFKYDDVSKAVQALGSLNMQNLVVGTGNAASTSSVVFGGTENNNQGQDSLIVGGNHNRNNGQNNVILGSYETTSEAFNSAIINGVGVTTQGKNIAIFDGSESRIAGNFLVTFGEVSGGGSHSVVFGDKVKNNTSNTFVFNGQDAEFKPEQNGAFYANSNVAINGDHANATLDVHGGMMIGNRGKDYFIQKNSDLRGVIALFSREKKTGLCGYDGKDNRRVPLSESARKSGLCAPMRNIGDLPENALSNNSQRLFPQVWNQNKTYGDWESPKWIYGSKDKPQHFLCKDGFVPDNSDPIGKTGVKCIECQGAKSGDLNCKTEKKPDLNKSCPPEAKYNETSKECERVTICTVKPGQKGMYDPNKTIEVYSGGNWVVTKKCQLTCPAGYEKKKDPISNNEYCEIIASTADPVEPCQTTKIRDYSQNRNSNSPDIGYLEVGAFIDPGCSIKNIEYFREKKCKDGYLYGRETAYHSGSIVSNTIMSNIIQDLKGLILLKKSKFENAIQGIEFTYDVYQGSKKIRSDSFSFDQKYCENGSFGSKGCSREANCGSSNNIHRIP